MSRKIKRGVIARLASCAAALLLSLSYPARATDPPKGPFEPKWDSIKANYKTP
jgi:hypothetical protein